MVFLIPSFVSDDYLFPLVVLSVYLSSSSLGLLLSPQGGEKVDLGRVTFWVTSKSPKPIARALN